MLQLIRPRTCVPAFCGAAIRSFALSGDGARSRIEVWLTPNCEASSISRGQRLELVPCAGDDELGDFARVMGVGLAEFAVPGQIVNFEPLNNIVCLNYDAMSIQTNAESLIDRSRRSTEYSRRDELPKEFVREALDDQEVVGP